MACLTFTVFEAPEGWFVCGLHPIGPLFSKESAVNLAEGMVAAIQATGEDAALVLEGARPGAASRFRSLRTRAGGRREPADISSRSFQSRAASGAPP